MKKLRAGSCSEFFISTVGRMLVFYNGKFLSEEKVFISAYDRGFQFADGIYEVIRYYYDHFFQTEAHLQRLAYGLSELRIQKPSLNDIKKTIDQLIFRNHLHDQQVLAYIQITRGAFAPRRHWFPPADTPPTVYISATPFTPHQEEIEHGVQTILTEDIRWSRCDIKSIALLPNVLARQQAMENGAVEAIMVRDGQITEGTHSNVCCIRSGILHTPPLSNQILAGVTRHVVLDLCRELNIPLSESAIAVDELSSFDEVLLVGTTVEITPVIRVEKQVVGTGHPGAITKKLQEAFYQKVLVAS